MNRIEHSAISLLAFLDRVYGRKQFSVGVNNLTQELFIFRCDDSLCWKRCLPQTWDGFHVVEKHEYRDIETIN